MISMDFGADLRAHIDARLLELGYVPEAAGVVRAEEAPYLMLLLRALRRMPAATPRQAILAPGFEVPIEHVDGFGALIRAVENGASLRPWLSTLVRKLKKRDELLDDWGIHHFHLGAVSSAKNRDFVTRTDEVAFAMVRPDAVYFLVATSHNAQKAPNVWTQTELVEIVHANWPELIATPKRRSNGPRLTAEDHARLRDKNVNAVVTMRDGASYYPPGGGMMSNGDASSDFAYQMQLRRRLEFIETTIAQHEAEIRASMGIGEAAPVELRARFRIEERFAIEIYDPARHIELRF